MGYPNLQISREVVVRKSDKAFIAGDTAKVATFLADDVVFRSRNQYAVGAFWA